MAKVIRSDLDDVAWLDIRKRFSPFRYLASGGGF
jgi:hypothetical protein